MCLRRIVQHHCPLTYLLAIIFASDSSQSWWVVVVAGAGVRLRAETHYPAICRRPVADLFGPDSERLRSDELAPNAEDVSHVRAYNI